MNRHHAYCIIAHNDEYCLETLIELIDDERNDIYLLIDKKAPAEFAKNIRPRKASMYVVPVEERIDIRWGDISLAEAEMLVLEKAVRSGKRYDYIHLLSGNDLPLKTQDEIYGFFEGVKEGSNFLEISVGEEIEQNLKNDTSYQYILTRHQRKVGTGLWPTARLFMARVLRHLFIKAQKLVGYKRKWGDWKLARGINWASLSHDFAAYIVENKELVRKKFKRVRIVDEIYKQTIAVNSPFDSTILAFSRGNSEGIRLIDWGRGNQKGNPKTWTDDDWDEIDSAFEIFARKFSSTQGRGVIDRLKAKLLKGRERIPENEKKVL